LNVSICGLNAIGDFDMRVITKPLKPAAAAKHRQLHASPSDVCYW
jgi:hypothetical protein